MNQRLASLVLLLHFIGKRIVTLVVIVEVAELVNVPNGALSFIGVFSLFEFVILIQDCGDSISRKCATFDNPCVFY
jgi:hypothetical protein